MNDSMLESLASRLATAKNNDTSIELSSDEAKLITSSLLELASSQTTIALQRTLLGSYDEDLQAIDSATAGALQGLAHELNLANETLHSIDTSAANDARQVLIEQIRTSHSIEHALTVVLRFAMIAGRLI